MHRLLSQVNRASDLEGVTTSLTAFPVAGAGPGTAQSGCTLAQLLKHRRPARQHTGGVSRPARISVSTGFTRTPNLGATDSLHSFLPAMLLHIILISRDLRLQILHLGPIS